MNIKTLLDANSSSGNLGRAAAWLPFDIFMEDALEGRRVPATSTAGALVDLVKSLLAVQGATWHDMFLGLWTAGLRHVNREREHIEGPKPHVESRLCMLLSVIPLASAAVITEEEIVYDQAIRRASFVSSLQVLGQFEGLLCPPSFAVLAANQAALTASLHVAGISSTGIIPDCISTGKPVGNMRHLIVEACLARGLLDTSAYLWPGYAVSIPNLPHSVSTQPSPWTTFMEGAALTGPLRNALMSTPAGSSAELEKIYETAIGGLEDEKVAAASILCGASLNRGWNVQEHAVRLAVKLLSPPIVPATQYIPFAPMLSAALEALTAVDAVHVMSLYGMFPELAVALLPICETFGSMSTSSPLFSSEDVSAHRLFSLAFLLLLRLWKFHRPPLEHRLLGCESPIGGDLSLDYLIQLRNSQVQQGNSSEDPVSLDSFPKLKAWYTQNEACVASTLSGLVRGNPVHEIADRLLNMMFKKNNSGAPANEERPLLPAWDIMTAVPFALDAVLTACGHGRLSSVDLTTGLRDLVDFLPATIASIVSYFTAEVTRGLWKYASMNGNDWPTPAGNLLSVEAEIKDILAATGVQIPSLVTVCGNAPASLPLPLAAFLSLTITFKQDKQTELVLGVAGPALESTAGGSPWPSMPVVAALWAQKIKKWHNYIVSTASRTVFKQDKNAVRQLLRSCFSVTLGSTVSKLKVHGGVGALLGHGGMQGAHYPVAPGILYLRIYPALHDILFVTDEILLLVIDAARDVISKSATDSSEATTTATTAAGRTNFARTSSFATCVAKVLQASTLGATLLHISGSSTLVQVLYSESLPTWFVSRKSTAKTEEEKKKCEASSSILEGYAIAHLSLLSGVLAWGNSTCSSGNGLRRKRILRSHMSFIACGMNGKIALGCDLGTWKAYVIAFISMVVKSSPSWIKDIQIDVLKQIAKGFRYWHERDLAISLLECSSSSAVEEQSNSHMHTHCPL